MSPSSTDVARSLAEAARAISAPHDLDETLDAIVNAARTSVPGFDHVGISVVRKDGIETKAATSQLVWELDDVQYRLTEGPCVDSIRTEPSISAPGLRHDQRWPRYVPEAVARGVRAQLAFRLYVDDHAMGGLNFYSTESEELQEGACEIGELFASHATIALGQAIEHDTLNQALATRTIIGEAIGLTMARFEITSDRAFQFLVRASSTSNIKIRDIAQEVVDQADEQYRPRE
ncbi:GAF and ANTAR domain-containing protein [Nocardioides sp. SYSU D00065]|uniref:GAF and ANTAR domain-containing protein n=1 Tax=Nocardioides sp. SYSU D00065 TaxID=2817378 RepID=UPI001B32092A|nr:GAF and ANTAR domain-containing protein [Nocardioides sp. SYSU D00065]